MRAALRYVASTPALAIPLGMMAVVGTLGFNFTVILPLLARFSFGGDASTYTALAVAMGAGSVIGALAAGARGRVGPGLLVVSALGFGSAALIAAVAPNLPLEILVLVPLGAASVTFAAGINSSLQLAADPQMRGRVMALFSIVFLGSAPIGAPIAGWLSETFDPRAALVMAGTAGIAAALGARAAFRRVAEDYATIAVPPGASGRPDRSARAHPTTGCPQVPRRSAPHGSPSRGRSIRPRDIGAGAPTGPR